MSVLRWCALGALVVVPATDTLASQQWGDPAARELVSRAIARREAAEADSGLMRWEAQARGTVLFLTQLGGESSPPRLVKADELVVEVYWEAPGHGKQRILAWRDRAWLPTDISYHRDHLGIVTNDFGPLIRIGEGDEVRDVPHPLSSASAGRYEFALGNAVTLESAGRSVTVRAVQVRPLDLATPAVVGTLYLDDETAALVRFRFSFTPSSYLEAALEDITVVLENALLGGRHWLPWRQGIEIRRQAGVVDFPARGIIRGSWELTDFRLGPGVAPRAMAGPAIDGLRAPGGPAGFWTGSLEAQVAEISEVGAALTTDELRDEVRAVAGRRLLRTGPPAKLAFGRVSDLIRVNRVEGVRLGLGLTLKPASLGGAAVSSWAGYGVSSHRLTGRFDLTLPAGPRVELRGGVSRVVEDLAGEMPLSVPLNSLLAQEFGVDRGDWVEREAWHFGGALGIGAGPMLSVRLALEKWYSMTTLATPSRGEYRPNPLLGAGRHGTLRIELSHQRVMRPGSSWEWRSAIEGGVGAGEYLRLDTDLARAVPLGAGEGRARVTGGWSAGQVPPARLFAIGGWGTLPGEPYRAFGGRWAVLGRLEYLHTVTVPELPLGSYAGTGGKWLLGPFIAAGAGGGGAPGGDLSWATSRGIRPVVGMAIEGFWGLVRAEFGWALRGGGGGGSVDLAKPWWGVL
ncbi:MAG TPA: hypothetical protein VMK53_02275 [Gemmatimonadales bacterium]|nr:hypothetical protein [Gemmatimonadales bacterium]